MGSGFSKMKKQARLMEQQLEVMRSELKTKEVSGKSQWKWSCHCAPLRNRK